MESKTVERVTEWDSEPFTGGHAGLGELAEREFTGAVTDGDAWLFMLNGRVLGVFDGDVAQFDDADGTAYDAPDQSLPLLFAMQETGGDVRGEYYSEETPISEVDRTLQSGNFTGYVELSENVLSGNYYLAYYGGRLLPVAFVGNQERRLSGDEAFERAADEVGIYRVKTVDLDITDVPEQGSSAAATEADNDDPASTAAAAGGVDDESEPSAAASDEDSGADDATTAATPGTEDEDPTATDESTTSAESAPADESTTATESAPTEEPSVADESADQDVEERSASQVVDATQSTSATDDAATASTQADESASESDEAASDADGDPFEAESEWRGTRTIPALDPTESVSMQTGGQTSGGATAAAADPEPAAESASVSEGPSSEEFEALEAERDRLRARVEELETEAERLGDERDRLETERDEAAETAEELEAELTELRATVDELESELETAESELSAAQEYVPEGDHELSPERAMEGTSLFVRYERKGGPTLEDAHSGDAGRDAVNDNVRLEHHTEFDDDGAIVDGEPFDEWLTSTIEYGFVQWLTRTFAHDVRETRNQTAMGKLFDAIPDVDRVEFRGTVSLDEAEDVEDADVEMESASFDVVLRDRMGQPLIVTDLNDSREPATEPMLESLIRNATPVGEANEQLAAAFFVTSSYYEPGALETAEEATGGGFLSRGKNKSFVKLSRKDGYHLCLVETREGEFHVSVPEL